MTTSPARPRVLRPLQQHATTLVFCQVALAAVLLLVAPGAPAEEPARAFLRCMQLSEDAERLACYDRLAQEVIEVGLGSGAAARSAPPPGDAGAPVTPTGDAAARPPPVVETRASGTPADQFGMEGRQRDDSPRSITARVVGGFNGWSGETRFELDNGQVWEQIGSGSYDYGGGDRAVVIRRGVFNSFMLSPEGLNRTVRVRRVE